MKKNQKGFTIIELIVVIAIIAVLAAIVLVNVVGYINKGKDAAIKANLSSLMVDAADIFNNYSSYNSASNSATTVCGASGPWTAINKAVINAGGNGNCQSSETAWCASSPMKTNSANYFCVDSTGKKVEGDVNAASCGNTFVCP